MSCLYSSPEVTALTSKTSKSGFRSQKPRIVIAINRRCHQSSVPSSLRPIPHASGAPNHSVVKFQRDFSVTRGQQERVPQQRKPRPPAALIILLAKQAQVSCVSIQAQYQAFVRFAVRSSAALSAIALNWTCVLEPFTRGGLSL